MVTSVAVMVVGAVAVVVAVAVAAVAVAKNWRRYKTETKDIGIQGSDAVLQPGVGYCITASGSLIVSHRFWRP
jgi:hypothetical protein